MAEVTVRFDVLCADRAGREIHVDVYESTGVVNHRTAVLVIHPGGWASGDRKMLGPQCEALARHGFTAVAVEYRLTPEAPWPAQLVDVKTAIRWTRSHAGDLEIDADKVVLQGHSAGAHLALMAAATFDSGALDPSFESEGPTGPIAAVVAYYPPTLFDPMRSMPDMSAGLSADVLAALWGPDGSLPAAMLLGGAATAESAAAASPLNYFAKLPPTVLFHGTADSLVATIGSVNLYESLSSVGIPSELHLMCGVDHAFDFTPSLSAVCTAVAESFLDRCVIDPSRFAEEEARTNPIAAARLGAHA